MAPTQPRAAAINAAAELHAAEELDRPQAAAALAAAQSEEAERRVLIPEFHSQAGSRLPATPYTAMMSSRPYRAEAMAPTAAAAEVREHAGTQLDPDVAWALLSVVAA